ncbi:MAG TPA: GNAT family N-acetyltransferase [Acidimicrobiales bacterium]|nr:GNAT family N-acetyltransferase [Acidimicrobiales bacterium]
MTVRPASDIAITSFEAASATDADIRDTHAVEIVIAAEQVPDEPPAPLEETASRIRRPNPSERVVHWLGRDAGGRAVGHARLEADLVNNPRLAWCHVMVVPDARRRGVGSALLAEGVRTAAALGRTTVGADTHQGVPGPELLAPLGFTPRLVGHRNRLLLADLDRSLVERWIDAAPDRAPGYTLRFWEGATPDDVLEPFTALLHVMNSAPIDDLDFEDETFTPEGLREREAARADRGLEPWTLCAVAPDGTLAGYTQLFLTRWRPWVALQNDTGVDPAHRNRGLGRWLKADMLLRLLRDRPEVDRIETWNAGSNDSMLHINHALGFRAIDVETSWQADTDLVLKSMEER